MNVQVYLNKLRLQRDDPTVEFLKRLQKQHLLTIPFENLSVHYGNRIVLDLDKIFKKIMPGNRGGYCYELNGLFQKLLTQLGFSCTLREARFWKSDTLSAPFDHMVILVNLQGLDYLVDVGMQSSFVVPKKLINGDVQLDYGKYFRFILDVDENWLLQQSADASNFSTVYRISQHPVSLIQFLDRNDQHQDQQDSYFVMNKFVSKLTDKGRVTLTNQKLTVLESGTVTETEIMNEDAFLSNLSQYFGIEPEHLVE